MKSLKEREEIIKNCNYLVFISEWIKNKFFLGINHNQFNNYKVVYHSLKKPKKCVKEILGIISLQRI